MPDRPMAGFGHPTHAARFDGQDIANHYLTQAFETATVFRADPSQGTFRHNWGVNYPSAVGERH
jgi:hypothetical protein